ncbi:hypothetical protein ASPZODRAFT_153509 [Penicilliopsis zonata CBS 506.65]|uniref:Mannose-6-phosphate isomerase n=1 Tax=Penicilliopsis zonata CBS 506.65 TaxID=1073090 RepID=A0A1L9SBP8_9EURO|nr:hypothetical protein ASPZODRAFT_153509 [Penicilliopsis zonata CBS 506.65]OJJ44586.1 hypothetical protein ASPZODRAFT_153509 [Penicilliopsis zonata CBS 506.65]
MAEAVVQLRCGVKNDGWGKKAKDSLAAQLWSKTPGTGPMWMGTYPKVPSYLVSTGEPLQEYLKKHPRLVGKAVLDQYGADIPFLPKILSFAKALPLQIHPNKSLASRLHEQDPVKFADSNHKPEIAVALSNFELFVGWKPLADIQALFKLNSLERFVRSPGEFTDATLCDICEALLTASPETVASTIHELQSIPESQFGAYPYIPGMLARLQREYSEFDNGNLVAALLMNYLTLGPGDAVYVPADSIHAYLCGDIFECMARSDNVLNTGFCPRAQRDNIALFTQTLSFAPHNAAEALLPRRKSDKGLAGHTDVYAPPIAEFNVLATCLGAGETETHKSILGPSLMIVTKGCGTVNIPGDTTLHLKEGHVFFVGQGVPLDFYSKTGMAVFRAYTE